MSVAGVGQRPAALSTLEKSPPASRPAKPASEKSLHILTVAYGHPSDTDQFDSYYDSTHRALVEKVAGVRAVRVLRCAPLDHTPPPYYLVAELTFDSAEAVEFGLKSPEGQAAAADLANFADGGATLFVLHD